MNKPEMALSRCDLTGLRLLLGLALLVASWFALTPQPLDLSEIPQGDKWAHLLTFLVLAVLLDASWPERGFDLPKWSFLLAYGLSIELLQSQIPNRFFSLLDLLANATGVALYALVLLQLLRRYGLRRASGA